MSPVYLQIFIMCDIHIKIHISKVHNIPVSLLKLHKFKLPQNYRFGKIFEFAHFVS